MNWINRNYRFCLLFIVSFITLFSIDILFRMFVFEMPNILTLVRIYLFDTAAALLITLVCGILPELLGRLFISIILLFHGLYAAGQLGFLNFMSNFMSWKIAFDSAERVTGNVTEFLLAIKPLTLLLVVLPIVSSIILFKNRKKMKETVLRVPAILILSGLIVFFHFISLSTMELKASQSGLYSAKELYYSPEPIEMAIETLGINRFLIQDFIGVFKEETDVPIIEEELIIPSSTPEILETIDYSRKIDDTLWRSLYESEENDSIKTIDEYLLKRTITDKNEMTGIFKGKNLIYIMVEAFDYMAVDETLTPTLYKMYTEGYSFRNYYTPKYSCTTAESEFIGLTSLVPQSGLCTPNIYKNNLFSQSIFNLFNRAGYTSTSYHNWNDQFYERNTYHPNMGSSAYYDVDSLNMKLIQGWQSDEVMMEKAYPLFTQSEPFFAFIITSSTHFPYDTSSTLGDRYLNEVSAVYPDMPIHIQRYISKAIELDKAMEYLLNELENQGILDDTVITVFADHHPLKTEAKDIIEWTAELDRSEGLNIDRTPCFIYNTEIESKEIDTLASTYDLVPTMANLFGLEYDPRFYVGRDIFSSQPGLAIFASGDWITEEGIYYASKNTFESFDGTEYSSQWIEERNNRVSNLFSISKSIYKTDYFRYRDFSVVEKE